jgi:NitT/TauT family transport system substrate-binding protein
MALQHRMLVFIAVIALLLTGCGGGSSGAVGPASGPSKTPPAQVRVGYFANVTHAQALIGISRGDFQKALGSVPLKTQMFNAGPSVVEAFFAGELDISYVGPSPAINAFVKSKGEAVRLVSGSAANGVVIVARKDSGISKITDLAGKRIATPQFGNTQDVSARHYITAELKQGLKENGGTTVIQNVANAEQLGLFKAGQIDAVWAPEPWGARVVQEADGVLIEEEKNLWPQKNFASTVVLVSASFLAQHPDVVETFLRAHVSITDWVNANRSEAAEIVNEQIKKDTGKALNPTVLKEAFGRIVFSTDPFADSVAKFAEWSYDLKISKDRAKLDGLIDLKLLEKVNKDKVK